MVRPRLTFLKKKSLVKNLWCVHDGSLVGISKEFIVVPTCDHHCCIWDVNLYHLNELFVLRLTEKEVGYRLSSLRYSKKHRAIIHWKNSVHHTRDCVFWWKQGGIDLRVPLCRFVALLNWSWMHHRQGWTSPGVMNKWHVQDLVSVVPDDVKRDHVPCLETVSVGTKTWTASQPLLHHALHHLPTSSHYLIAKMHFASLHLCIVLSHFESFSHCLTLALTHSEEF